MNSALLVPFLLSFLYSPTIAQQPITCCPSSLNSTSLGSTLPSTAVSPVVGDTPKLLESYNGSYALKLGVWQDTNAVTYCMAGVTNLKISPASQLWAVNNAKPLQASSCILKLSDKGDLSLQVDGNRMAWNSGTAGLGVQSLVLHESGNLVLQNAQGGSVWQSFQQSPVFYVASGMNFTTNTTLFSSAPIGPSDFSVAGKYGMSLSSQGRLFLYANGNSGSTPFVYWSSGVDSNSKSVAYATIEDGIMFYDNQSMVLGSIKPTKMPRSGTRRIILIDNPSGNLFAFYRDDHNWTLFYNSSMASCENPYLCGEFSVCDPATAQCSCPTGFKQSQLNQSSGCEPSIDFGSNAGCFSKGYTFVTVNVSFHPQMSVLSPKSPEDCQTSCLESCSCRAALYDSGTRSCSFFSVLQTLSKAGNGSQLLFLKIAVAQKPKKWVVIGSVSGIIAFALLSSLVAFCCCRNSRRLGRSSGTDQELFLTEVPRLPPRFSYRDLQAATKDFSIKLGAGAFGSVYEGVLPSGVKIAVKKLEGGQDQSWDQFRAEVATIGSISHVNLVTLRGFCMEGGTRLLVYEHMANSSLDKWLFPTSKGKDSTARGVLDWGTRCRIALETARGLAYLHHECGEKIVHCDVKPENILLDTEMGAKVADFGLAKLVPGGHQSFAMTTLKGTRGYLAPEWLRDATITPRIDVYSFGVVVLELVSGRRCLSGDIGYLPTCAMRAAAAIATPPLVMQGSPPTLQAQQHAGYDDLFQLLDPLLRGRVPFPSLERVVRIALWCVQSKPASRPTMATLVQMLEGVIDVPPPPLLSSLSLDNETFSSCLASESAPTISNSSSFPSSFPATTSSSSATPSSSSLHVEMLTSVTNLDGKSPSPRPSSWLLAPSDVY